MGRPYGAEMDAMQGTYELALSSDIGSLAGFAGAAAGAPLYAVGSGGSLTAAALAAALHHGTGSAAEALTPLAFLDRERLDCSGASVLLFTAGGCNADILAALDRAIALRPRALGVVCASPRSRAARAAARARGACLQAGSVPAGRDGFLATNSLLAMSVWACRAYEGAGLAACRLPEFADLAGDDDAENIGARAGRLHVCTTLAVLHDAWGRIAAIDLESKMSEGGLVGVQMADYRHFAHGRHNWLDKRAGSGVVALASPGCERLASSTLECLPGRVPVLRVDTRLDGPAGALALLVQSMRLVGSFGAALGVDPGRPRVAAFGRRLYGLRYRPPPLDDATDAERAALCKKFGTHRMAGPGERRLCDLRRFAGALASQKFGAIVFDYDGTLVGTQDRKRPPRAAVKKLLCGLLSSGIMVCVATGRGKSVREALQKTIGREHWPRTLIGYYNGADIGPLDDAGVPDKELPMDPALDEFLSVKGLNGALASAKSDPRPHQITYEGSNLSAADIADQLAATAPRTARKVKIVESAHSVDVVAAATTKKALARRAGSSIREGLSVLCVGDMGRPPGNDHELLSGPHSLSVGDVSDDPHTCWNLLPPDVSGPDGTIHYMQRLKVRRGHFRVGELR